MPARARGRHSPQRHPRRAHLRENPPTPASGHSRPGRPPRAALPPGAIKHIFVIDLENESEATTFGPNSPATYLNGTLLPQGEFLKNYYATGHVSLDNYTAQISGQAPTEEAGRTA